MTNDAMQNDTMQPVGGKTQGSEFSWERWQWERPALPPKQVFVLMGCALLLGILFDRLVAAAPVNSALGPGWGAFWLGFATLFCALFWRKAVCRWQAWAVAGIAVLLCAGNLLRSRGVISIINLPVIPLLLVLCAQLITAPDPAEADRIVGLRVLQGFFLWPFTRMGDALSTSVTALGKAGKGRGRGILIGLCVAAPLLAVVCTLLLQADAVALHLAQNIVRELPIGQTLLHVLCVLAIAALLCSFLINARLGGKLGVVHMPPQSWEPATVAVVLASLAAVYALFCAVQFAYLFGSQGLPAGLTYSKYARQGFGELLAVAAINLGVFALTLRFARPHALVRALQMALLVCTGVLLASGLLRLGLYIGAYGLTWLRVFPYTFMVALCVVLALCAARLFVPKLPLLRIVALVCMLWYAGLALVNVEALMVRWNVRNATHTMRTLRTEEKPYVFTLSSDAVPELLAYCQTLPEGAHEWVWLHERLDELRAEGSWSLADRRAEALLAENLDAKL